MNHQPNTPASINETVADAQKRVLAFVDEYSRRRGLDPEQVYSLGLGDDSLPLNVSDLRALAAPAAGNEKAGAVARVTLADVHRQERAVAEVEEVHSRLGGLRNRLNALAAPGAAIDAREQERPPTHQLLDWLKEREANARRLATTSPDRDAWLEDAEYFSAAARTVWESTDARERKALEQISSLLTSMFVSARAHVQGDDEIVVGYTVRNGALHKIVGILASYKPVIIPSNLPTAHETITGILTGTSASRPEAPPASASPATVAQPVADGSTPGEWFVRKHFRGGVLRDAFVAAPDCQGLAYDAEILGDDEYRDTPEDADAGIKRKVADCELIVAAVKSHRAQPCASQGCGGAMQEAVANVVSCWNRFRWSKETSDAVSALAALSTAPRSLDGATPGGSECSDERPCLPCYLDQGMCEAHHKTEPT